MAMNASQKNDMPALLAMLAEPQPVGSMDGRDVASLKQKLNPNKNPNPMTTPNGPADVNDYTQMLAMGAPVPQLSAEEKSLQQKLMEQTQAQNKQLEGDVEQQRKLAAYQNYLMQNQQEDITPYLQNLYNFAGVKGDAALQAAKPKSTADLAEKLSGYLKGVSSAQNTLSDNEMNLLKMRLQFANAKGQMGSAAKTQQLFNKYYSDLAKETNPSQATSRGGMGSPYKSLLAIDRVQGMLDSQPDYNKLTDTDVNEMYEALAQVVAGGSGNVSEARVAALVPHNRAKTMAGVKQWLSSKPEPAQQAEFVKKAEHLLNREKAVLTQNVRKAQLESFQGKAPLFATDPRANLLFQQLLQARGFKPDMSYDPEASLTGYIRPQREATVEGGSVPSPQEWLQMKRGQKP